MKQSYDARILAKQLEAHPHDVQLNQKWAEVWQRTGTRYDAHLALRGAIRRGLPDNCSDLLTFSGAILERRYSNG